MPDLPCHYTDPEQEEHVPFSKTATRLWKRLTPEERAVASSHFWRDPPAEPAVSALAAIVKARRMRPQVARTLGAESKAKILSSVLDPGESVAASLLVALHLGERRELLAAFLDAVSLAHEDGVLKDEAGEEALGGEAARDGVRAIDGSFPREQVTTYLNSLCLQDPEVFEHVEDIPVVRLEHVVYDPLSKSEEVQHVLSHLFCNPDFEYSLFVLLFKRPLNGCCKNEPGDHIILPSGKFHP